MKKSVFLLFASVALVACNPAAPDAGEENSSSSSSVQEDSSSSSADMTGGEVEINYDESSLTFTGESNIINHEGEFGSFEVAFTLDEDTPSDFTKSQLNVTIDTTSITADGTGVDGHLLREDFFDVENYPEATFESTAIVSNGGDNYSVTGNMTVKGQTKAVTFDAVITAAGMDVTFDFPRQEFGVGNDSYGDKLLEPLVPVEAHVVFAS